MNQISFPSLESSVNDKDSDNLEVLPQGINEKPITQKEDSVGQNNRNNGNISIAKEAADSNAADLYGYGDAAPDSAAYYDYEVAAPDTEDYGYEEAVPEVRKISVAYEYDSTRIPRRSSMKGSNGGVPRRASMGCTTTNLVEVRVRGNRFPVQRRRSIDFCNTIEVKEVTPVPDMTDTSQVWLQEEDFAEMKKERRTLVHKVKRGEVDQREVDIRGLEKYVDKSIRREKNMAWDTVLLEQDEQEISGNYNDQRIADLYKHTTFASPEKAVARAQQDEAAVREYLMSPRTTKLMMRRLSC